MRLAWLLLVSPLLLGLTVAPVSFPAGPGAAIAPNKCLICHGGELIVSQRLTSAQWTKEVGKMVGWGAPLSKEEQQVLAAYLAKHFPVDKAPLKPARVRGGRSLRVPGLWFVGVPWMTCRKSPLLMGVGEDATAIARALAAG